MYNLSAIELRNRFLKGEVSAQDIAAYFIARVKKMDTQLGAFIAVYEKQMLAQANELDRKKKNNEPLGKMAAIPVALKDNMHIKGEISTCGSKFLSNYKAVFDATIVEQMRKEDALFMGKTNMDEFAMGSSTEYSAYQKTTNPWDLSCVPGGSSGGSAAAVSARLLPIAFGSDTGGSIRQPAAMCGIYGYKPTYGRVSRYGLVAHASSFDQIGPLTHHLEDIALVMEVIGKHCKKDATSLPMPGETYLSDTPSLLKGAKIGVPWAFIKQIPEESLKNFSKTIDLLKSQGAEIIDVDLDILRYAIATYYILTTAEASTNLARFDGIRYGIRSKNENNLSELYRFSREEGFGREVKQRIMLGTYVLSAGYHDAYYTKALKVRQLIIDAFEKAFDTCDFIVMPITLSTAFKIDAIHDPLQMYLQDIFTVSINLAGLPSLALPSGLASDNKPLGIQFIGPQLHDVNIVRYGLAYEKVTECHKVVPPHFDKEAE